MRCAWRSQSRQFLALSRQCLAVGDLQHAGLLVCQRVGDELDQQVEVLDHLAPSAHDLAPSAHDRSQHAALVAELVQPGLVPYISLLEFFVINDDLMPGLTVSPAIALAFLH